MPDTPSSSTSTATVGRVCAGGCGTALSRYNDDELCQGCQRRASHAMATTRRPGGRVVPQGDLPADERYCSGPHPAPAQPGAERIDWRHLHAEELQGRTVSETCTRCGDDAVYELVTYGGGRALRRTQTRKGHRHVDQTVLLRARTADELWHMVLAGAAR